MSILKQSLILIPVFMLLSACGGADGCTPSDGRPLDTTTDTSATCAVIRSPNTIVISFPVTNAIEQLTGEASAIYSRKGSVIVTDQNGNAVSDGTIVQLDVFDTLIGRGTITGTDSITGTTIVDANPFQGDNVILADLDTVAVNRGGDSNRTIKVGDLVVLQNAASSDQIRYVSSTGPKYITVNNTYNNSYPSTIYSDASYLIGQSLVGTSILGIDDAGNKTAGYTITKNGIGSFRIEYPGDNDHLNYGLVDYAVLTSVYTDPRPQYAPNGSTEVWVVADAGGSVALADRMVLSGIAPSTITANPATATISAATISITVTVKDASNVRYPLVYVSASSSNESAATVDGCITGSFGTCTAIITFVATSATPVTIRFTAFDASVTVTLTVN